MPQPVPNLSKSYLRIFLAMLALAAAVLACNRPASRQTPAVTEPLFPLPAKGSETTSPGETDAAPETAAPNVFVYLPFAPAQKPVGEATAEAFDTGQVDARVELLASSTNIKVGETVTILGFPVDLSLPSYYLIVRDEGVQSDSPLAVVSFENKFVKLDGSSKMLAVVSGEGSQEQASFVLQGLSPGITTITISATGEIRGSDGSIWSGTGSGSIVVTVTP